MVVIAAGKTGASALFHAEEGDGFEAESVITRLHSMAERTAQTLEPRLNKRDAILMIALVSGFFFT